MIELNQKFKDFILSLKFREAVENFRNYYASHNNKESQLKAGYLQGVPDLHHLPSVAN